MRATGGAYTFYKLCDRRSGVRETQCCRETTGRATLRRVTEPAETATAWVVPTGDVCPTTHPVKAKLASKIFHLPGMLNYDRTRPDRCYRDATAAEGDGLRPAKR